MNTKLSFRLNAATFSVAGLVILITLFGDKPAEQIAGNVIATLFWIGVYYLFFSYIVPKWLLKKQIVLFFVISLIIVLMLPCIGYTLLFLSRGVLEGNFNNFYRGYGIAMHISGFKAMAMAGVYGSFFRLICEHFRT